MFAGAVRSITTLKDYVSVPNELFFFLVHIHFLLSSGRVHLEAAHDYTTWSYELMFHFTEETSGDYDRLQRGGIVLIEMNIIIFLRWYFSCLPSKTRQIGVDPHRVRAVGIKVITATPVLWFWALWGEITARRTDPREIFENFKLHLNLFSTR